MPGPGEVEDGEGYNVKPRDLVTAGITPDEAQAMLDRRAPLGFTARLWANCVQGLQAALANANLDDADVRIHGTSAQFFSDQHKPFPQTLAELRQQAPAYHVSDADVSWLWHWLDYEDGPDLPHYHFFDSRRRFRIALSPSDYDIQLSSDKLDAAMWSYMRQYPNRQVRSSRGGHYKHEYVAEVFPSLGAWAQDWIDRTGRQVNVAGFPSVGPTGSSRFASTDWVIVAAL